MNCYMCPRCLENNHELIGGHFIDGQEYLHHLKCAKCGFISCLPDEEMLAITVFIPDWKRNAEMEGNP